MKNGMIGAIFFRASFRRLDNLPFRLDSFNGTASAFFSFPYFIDSVQYLANGVQIETTCLC